MAKIIEAPNVDTNNHIKLYYTIFLAGSIENGKAENWQEKLIETLVRFDNIVILNPRRKHWSELEKNNLRFQIAWEQEGIEKSDLVVFYFHPATQSPISLLELGQCLGSHKKVIVYCPPNFFRYTNVEITCERYSIKPHKDYQVFIADIISHISRFA